MLTRLRFTFRGLLALLAGRLGLCCGCLACRSAFCLARGLLQAACSTELLSAGSKAEACLRFLLAGLVFAAEVLRTAWPVALPEVFCKLPAAHSCCQLLRSPRLSCASCWQAWPSLRTSCLPVCLLPCPRLSASCLQHRAVVSWFTGRRLLLLASRLGLCCGSLAHCVACCLARGLLQAACSTQLLSAASLSEAFLRFLLAGLAFAADVLPAGLPFALPEAFCKLPAAQSCCQLVYRQTLAASCLQAWPLLRKSCALRGLLPCPRSSASCLQHTAVVSCFALRGFLALLAGRLGLRCGRLACRSAFCLARGLLQAACSTQLLSAGLKAEARLRFLLAGLAFAAESLLAAVPFALPETSAACLQHRAAVSCFEAEVLPAALPFALPEVFCKLPAAQSYRQTC